MIAFIFLTSNDAFGQPRCGFDEINQKLISTNSRYRKSVESFNRLILTKDFKESISRKMERRKSGVYEIPLVFHIIHTGGAIGAPFNPTDQKIIDLVDYLNQTYAASWSGYPASGAGGANIPLRFVLAKRDPNCNTTTGINRINVNDSLNATDAAKYVDSGVIRTTGGISDFLLKSIVQWDPAKYYNIWVVNKIDGWSGYVSGSGVVGYAYHPFAPAHLDGTVIMEAFSAAGQTTLPHEMGHAFSLYHTFNDTCNLGDCATTGDLICDTESHDQTSGCPGGTNPCTGVAWGPVINNIMNYTACPDRFTQGQSDRVMSALFYARPGLLNSAGGIPPGGGGSYPTPVANSCVIENGAPNNNFDVGPTSIAVADFEYFSMGYTFDGYQSHIDHTLAICSRQAEPPINLEIGKNYPVDIGTKLNQQNVRMWIDWDNSGTFSASELTFSHNGISSGDELHTGTITVPATATSNTALRVRIIADYISNPNPDACGSNLQYGQAEDFSVFLAAPLPVNLLSIEATAGADNKSIDLSWVTAKEDNVSHFEIERGTNGKEFIRIGKKLALNAPSSYLFTDENPVFNYNNLYRLKMVEKDGNFKYSKVVSASVSEVMAQQVEIYPNPAGGFINIVAPSENIFSISITNTIGQEVYLTKDLKFEKEIPQRIEFGNNKLKPGLYFIQLKDKTGSIMISKFVKR